MTEHKVKGNLIIIGGAEDKKDEKVILKQVAKMAGGKDARLTVLTTATESPIEVGNDYRDVFHKLGIGLLEILNIDTRGQANMQSIYDAITRSTAVFFTGGDQLRITSILGGTLAQQALYDAYMAGTHIVGTSAGASVMSNTMVVDGDSNEPARKCTLHMSPGLSFMKDAIIDQHFDQRGRIGRLLCGVAQNPHMIGIGIDEDTAIVVQPDYCFTVIGSNAVTVIDGTTIESSNVSELKPDEILAINNVTLHVLPRGYGYDMRKRKVTRQEV